MTERDLTGATWFKSSYSPTQDECVEVALVPGGAGVRDTKDRDGGTLSFTSTTWSAFLSTLKD
ncbi:DUF397 domain-containing protein [Saccharopolyspora gregorii]|uniref:DUF397 domain-containing protein n=1 Tax=Saccharopolyspora gregorii TaxID=33914 RepID=UPI0021ACD531|nr:DUF397 domain-containing protein [Saccharopolyspora gregorii]